MVSNKTQDILLAMYELAEQGVYFNPLTKEYLTGEKADCKSLVKQFLKENKTLINGISS